MRRIFLVFLVWAFGMTFSDAFAQIKQKSSVLNTAGGSAQSDSLKLTVSAAGQLSPPSVARAGNHKLLSGYVYTLLFKSSANRPPSVTSAIADQTLIVGGSDFTLDLMNTFSDPDGDALIYSASSSNTVAATATILGRSLTVRPVAVGASTIGVRANDGRGGAISTTFNATVIQLSGPALRDTVAEREIVTILVTPSPNFQPNVSQLYYRQGGQRAYQVLNLTPSGNSFNGAIPSDFVTIRGVEYYLFFSNGQTNVTFPAANPQNQPAIVHVRVVRLDYPLALPPRTPTMIGAPIVLDNPAIDAVLLDDYGEYEAFFREWRLFRWQDDDYAEYPNINAAFTPGTAFWLVTRSGRTFDIENGLSVNSGQSFTIALAPDWNQIANPFAFPVAWDSVQVIGEGESFQAQAPVRWNGEEYEYNQRTLQPWEGYFVYSTGNVVLSVPPRESQGVAQKPATLPRVVAKELILQLKARGLKSGWKDEQNFVGMLAGAADGLDAHDFLEAPPIGDHLRLSIVDENVYAGNFRAISEQGGFWDLQFSTTGQKEGVRLSFAEQQELPAGFQLWLLDRDRQRSFSIEHGQVEIEVGPQGVTANLRLIVGTPAFADRSNEGISLVPRQFALRQNYPNPFNPETRIEYELAEGGEARLEIYNVLGQRVRTLAQGVQTTGAYHVIWDGKDGRGNMMSSGVYLCRLKAGEFAAVRKLVLSR
jgi:hypothetical protein